MTRRSLQAGCRGALGGRLDVLSRGGHALRRPLKPPSSVLEDDPVFDAGYGSHLNSTGQVECDAIVMDAALFRAGSVRWFAPRQDPICLARAVFEKMPGT